MKRLTCLVTFGVMIASGKADVYRQGFEEFALDATVYALTNAANSRICCNADDACQIRDVSQETYAGGCGYPNRFSSLGSRCLMLDLGWLKYSLAVGVTANEKGRIGSGVVQREEEILVFDVMVKATGYEEPLTSIPVLTNLYVQPQQTISQPGKGGGMLRVCIRGFSVAVDEDVILYATEFWNDDETVASTNWCVLAGVKSGNDGTIPKTSTLLPCDGGATSCTLGEWHRVAFERTVCGGDVLYSIRIDGRRMAAADESGQVPTSNTNFLALVAKPSDPARALRFFGIGAVDDISIYRAFNTGCGIEAFDDGDGTWHLAGTGIVTDLSTIRDEGVTNLVIESGIAEIGANVFSGWRSLRDVSVGADCSTIGANAFSKCYNLTNATFAATGLTLGDYAFLRCNALRSLTFAEEPTYGEMPFAYHAEIYLRDGMPEVYAVPQITIAGMTQVLLGKTNLTDAAWCEVKDEQTRAGCRFFKIELK